jgi:hypothetical protein
MDSQCKGPEAGTCFLYSKNSRMLGPSNTVCEEESRMIKQRRELKMSLQSLKIIVRI